MAKWIIDPDHSVAEFSVRHMMVANVRGLFSGISGAVDFDPADLSRLTARVEIEVAGLTSGIAKRDAHLLSPDFFDAANHPKIIFRSTGAIPLGPNRARMSGELTIRGTTRPVTFEVEFLGPVKSAFGGETTIGFAAETTLDRYDFGVSWNESMEGGGVVAAREVRIALDVEADLVEE